MSTPSSYPKTVMSADLLDRISRSRSRSSEDSSQYPLKISLSQDLISHFNDPEMISKIRSGSSASKITINQNLDSSNYSEGIINIFSSSVTNKLSALNLFLDEISEITSSDKLQFDLFLPESKVNTLSNLYGTSLSALQKSSNATVSIQKRISGLRDKALKLSGKVSEVKDLASIIYRSAFERKYSPPHKVKVNESRYEEVSYKFAAPGDIAIDISDKRSSIWKKFRTEFGLDVGIRDSKPPLKDTDAVIVRIIHSIPTNLLDY
ncbi:hypothetical protein SteCoe_33746 [Stentor coeruleus]|uniref:Uncharacterized protein n=1 Tax=Stentor coeruleus TaxID=5963 RepID=A0A1R2AW46_9CILI|nr:hypothetical protein SteCoe_33746 [Stentor coeruleus]